LVALAFGHNLQLSWLKWGNLVMDGGRELELPLRMLRGDSAYVQVRNIYPPLAPALNMFLFWAFGVHLDVLLAAGILTAAAMCAALYLIGREFLAPAAATVVTIAFLYICGFAHLVPNPAFTWAFPYAYAATYGTLAATLSLLFLLRHVRLRTSTPLALSLLFAVAACSTKLEAAVAVVACHGTFLLTGAWTRTLDRTALRLYCVAAAVLVGIYGALYLQAGPELWTDNLAAVANVGSHRYWLVTSGLFNLRDSLLELLRSAAVLAGAATVASLVGWLLDQPSSTRWVRAVAVGALCAAVAAAYVAVPVTLPFRVLPLLTAGCLVGLSATWLRRSERRAELLPRLLLWTFTAGCLSRIPLRAIPHHYGFFLLPVPILSMAVLLYRDLPAWWGQSGWSRACHQATATGLLAGAAIGCLLASRAAYAQHTRRVETPRGALVLAGDGLEAELIGYLSRLPPETTILTIPHGAGLTFMSGLRSVDGTFSYLPLDLHGRYSDERLVERWNANPPDLVCLYQTDMLEFGFRGFGLDYGQAASTWIQRNYSPITGSAARMVVLRRNVADTR
jgi:hypothetical protein